MIAERCDNADAYQALKAPTCEGPCMDCERKYIVRQLLAIETKHSDFSEGKLAFVYSGDFFRRPITIEVRENTMLTEGLISDLQPVLAEHFAYVQMLDSQRPAFAGR